MRVLCGVLTFLFLCTLASPKLSAQRSLKGVVKDEQGRPVRAANTVIRQVADGPIFSFSITEDDGAFALHIPPGADSVFFTITHLSYAKQAFYVPASETLLEITLSEAAYELPELVVKNKPVIRQGDTLIFDVGQYRDAADRNIEEVLRKLPGVTISQNGTIQYDGLPISKFYIEGLDMLEGRYRLATRNLSIDAIRDIEIIESHQPIRALDSLVRPPNAAINLRLKSDVAVTGTIRAGLGASPALYQGQADVFGFTKKQHFNLLGSANNVGDQQRANFQNLYFDPTSLRTDLIRINEVLPPFQLEEEFYLDNQEFTGGFNFLRKVAKNTEFKWQGFVRRDRIRKEGSRLLRYTDEENTFSFEEILAATEQVWELDNRLIVEHNAPKIYLRADAQITGTSADLTADNIVNRIPFPEQLDDQRLQIDGGLTTIFRRNDKAYKINTDIDYKIMDYNLRLMPVDVFAPDFELTRFESGRQLARQNIFTADTYTDFYFLTEHLSGQLRAGLRYEHATLSTDFRTRTDSSAISSLGTDFQNDNQVQQLAPYLEQTYELQRGKHTWKFSLPFSVPVFRLENQIAKTDTTFIALVTKPRLTYERRLSPEHYLSAGYTLERDYLRYNQFFYDGYIMRSNRNLDRSVLDINQLTSHELFARFTGKNLEKGLDYNLSFSLFANTLDYLNDNRFNEQGLTSNLIEEKNTTRGFSFGGDISGPVTDQLRANLQATYRFHSSPNLLNGQRSNVQNHLLNLQMEWFYIFPTSVLTVRPRIQILANSFSETPTTYQMEAEVGYFQSLNRLGSVRVSYFQFCTVIGNRQFWNELLALEYKYTFSKSKINLIIQCNNLSNNENYISFRQSAFSETLSAFRLRPRQLVLRVKKTF